jgi:hypothetical protein
VWVRALSGLLGIWLMAAPDVLGYGAPAATSDRIVGPVAASVAVVAMSAVTRGVRWLNLLPGGWLLVAPWLLGYPPAATVNSLVVGLLLIGLAFVRGPVTAWYGGGWAALLPGRVPGRRPDAEAS